MDVDRRPGGTLKPLSASRHGERCTLLAPDSWTVLKMLQRAYQSHV